MHNGWRTVMRWLLVALFVSWATVAFSPAQGQALAPAPAQACTELVVNGGFETTGGWELDPSPLPPQYVTSTAHSGTRSLQLGITSDANTEGSSSARQTVTIPTGASQVTLSYWFYAVAESPQSADFMELALLTADGSVVLAKPWQSRNDSRVWNQIAFDLSSWQGQTIQLYFTVHNDGQDGKAAMFLDDVSLSNCPATVTPGTPAPTNTRTTPTATTAPSTFTPTATPGCAELVRNGSFDNGLDDWEAVGDPGGVTLGTDLYRSAPYSLKLGSLDVALTGLAAARQLITIPAGAPTVTLDVWIYTQSQPGAGADYQEIALLNASGGLLYVPYRGPANDSAWVRLQFNLAAFAGQTAYLRFAVNNDGTGGHTAMYVDDVRLTACSSGAAPAAALAVAPAPTDTPVPFATWTLAPTWTSPPQSFAMPPAPSTAPLLEGCVELTQNGGFEAAFAGWVPGANPLRAAVVTAPVLNGAYAAQVGSQPGPPPGENLNSYSSIRQTVSVPWGYARTLISFWVYTWAEFTGDGGADRQQFVLLGPGNVVWAVPWKVQENAQAWEQHMYELVGVGGQTFDLYFGTVNDGKGGRTALYVDEVHLWGCPGGAWPPVAPSQAAETMAQPPMMVQAETAQPVPVPQVYPVETLPAMVLPEELAGAMAAEPQTAPAAEWTVIAIGTAGAPAAVREVVVGTPALEPLASLVETPVGAAVDLVGTLVPGTPEITVSLTPQPANFLSNLTAKWPPNWPWILVGILVVAVVIMLLVRARQSPMDVP